MRTARKLLPRWAPWYRLRQSTHPPALVLLILWPRLPLTQPPGGSTSLAPAGASADGETPDCKDATPDPYPRQQRLLSLARLGATRWHDAGQRGQGMKIAILDTGFRG